MQGIIIMSEPWNLHFIIRALSRESSSSGSKGSLDFFVRDFRFRPRARASGQRDAKKKRKKRKVRETRKATSHLPRIYRATDFFVRCITLLLSADNIVADESRWIVVYRLFHSWNADRRAVCVFILVCAHTTYTKRHIQTNA